MKNLSDTCDHQENGRSQFCTDVLRGLRKSPKELPCKYFYDETGSRLFEQICELEEYYPTRTELAIMREHAAETADCLGPDCLLIEYGSGSSLKTRLLLDQVADRLAAYVPLDISREHLDASAREIAKLYPRLEVMPVSADFTDAFELPTPRRAPARRVVYFPGSTLGNFNREAAKRLLGEIATVCGNNGGLLLGLDLEKDVRILEGAYNDGYGVTAEFNRNLLVRINRELGADFAPQRFEHHAPYSTERGCIEMYLVSTVAQQARLAGETIEFRKGERILTEQSHKYRVPDFTEWASEVGWNVEMIWTDREKLFSVQYLTVKAT